MALSLDIFQQLAPPLRQDDKARLLTRLQAEHGDETDELVAAAWAMGARAFCNTALGRRICRVCGCWELDACPGGCAWAAEDLCSACDVPVEQFQFQMDDAGVMSIGEGWRRDDDATSMRLQLVSIEAPIAVVASWSDEQVQASDVWAYSTFLQASDNDDVQVPAKPAHLPDYASFTASPGSVLG